MNKEEYKILLQNPKWVAKRKKIFKRDNYCCQKCGSTWDINCHHIHYIKDKLPWQVPDEFLVTLCRDCHEAEHKGKNIQSFVIEPINKVKVVKRAKKRIKQKKKVKIVKLSKRDKIIQERYNKLKI